MKEAKNNIQSIRDKIIDHLKSLRNIEFPINNTQNECQKNDQTLNDTNNDFVCNRGD